MSSRTPPHLAKQPSFLADTRTPSHMEISAPCAPLSSRRHRGPHRDGFSVKKCRDVLVRQCSWIPRNYNFKDGVNQVYEVLREYLGDENLDLAIAQLNELIEVPSQWLHDEGASFQAWKHDYMLRYKDFENSHVPRLRNIIVAPVNPTEHLKRWREDHPDRVRAAVSSSQSSHTPSSDGEIRSVTPDYGIGSGARGGNWRLENAIFVSSRAQGTRVLHCPSPQELHKKTWNEDFGRGGKLVQERIVNPGEPVDIIDHTQDQALPLKRKKSSVDPRSMQSFVDIPVLGRIQSINFAPEKFNTSLRRKLSIRGNGWHARYAETSNKGQARPGHIRHDPLQGRFASEVKIYESDPAVRELPDPESDTGKPYYRNISTWPLPPGICIPSPRFARKHDIVPEEIPLPGGVPMKLVPTADEVAIEKGFQYITEIKSRNSVTHIAGPFTPELFKDGGIDFPRNWGDTEYVPAGARPGAEGLSDMGALGDAAQSPSKHLESISKKTQRSSSPFVVTGSKRYDPAGVPNPPPHHPVLTYLTKTLQQSFSEPFQAVGVAIQEVASRSKGPHYRDLWNSSQPYRWVNSETITALNCAIMETTSTSRSPSIILNGKIVSAGHEIENNEKNEQSLLNEIPETTRHLLAYGSKKCSTFASDLEKAFVRKGCQICKVANENLQVVEAPTSILGSIVIEEATAGALSTEPAMEILQETSQSQSETELDYSCLRAKKYKHVQKSYKNNNNAAALSKRERNNIKNFIKNSLEVVPGISLKLIHKEIGLKKSRLDLQGASEMDLNRDLPPLPTTTDSQSLQLGDKSHHQSLESRASCNFELLQPLFYDPVRDSLKYGGLHYHLDGMRYYPEVPQHPPRTSSMPQTDTASRTTGGMANHHVKAKEPLKPSPPAIALAKGVSQPSRASDASHGSEGSSGIMGNFIPVTTVASPSVIVTRAVHVPRIETTSSTWAPDQNPKLNSTNANVPCQLLNCVQKDLENNNRSKLIDHDTKNIQQGIGASNVLYSDHDSIDINDPEALAKYIRHLKKMKEQAAARKMQSPESNTSLSQNLDGEAGRYVDSNEADDYTFVNPDEGAEASHFIAQDYSEIRAGNPFAFEADDKENDPNRITTLTDFMGGASRNYERTNIHPQLPGKTGHLKNSHSESNAFYTKKRPEPIQIVERSNMLRHILQRSDSSPTMSPNRVPTPRNVTKDSLQSFYEEDGRSYYQTVDHSEHSKVLSGSPIRSCGILRTSPIQLDNVPENREAASDTLSPSQKHPWSPVKLIFGDGGWFNNSATTKDESPTSKKTGLVEKIKLKIEEIGLKADLSPKKNQFRSDQGKSLEQSTFPISLNPAQQAELYLDIELLICDSANTFLMNEYHNSRMSVDSLKKVTDFWKSKGRPQVVEFHYDQSTQRDIIVANQKTFRFYGPNANNPLKVHAMLYAWKTNAREMAVRTFCYPDSMIRRHIRDAFVILDFLGGHPFQYIAAHEVQKKLVRWINEGHMSKRPSGLLSVQKLGRRSTETDTELVVENPWYSSGKTIQRPNNQINSSQDFNLTT